MLFADEGYYAGSVQTHDGSNTGPFNHAHQFRKTLRGYCMLLWKRRGQNEDALTPQIWNSCNKQSLDSPMNQTMDIRRRQERESDVCSYRFLSNGCNLCPGRSRLSRALFLWSTTPHAERLNGNWQITGDPTSSTAPAVSVVLDGSGGQITAPSLPLRSAPASQRRDA